MTTGPDYEDRSIYVTKNPYWNGIIPFPPLPVTKPRFTIRLRWWMTALAAAALLWYTLYICARAGWAWIGPWL
jgi:hypothetical protein